MSWKIDKTLECCYGHRVFTQKLNGEFSDDLKCACRHLHGHEGKIQVYLEGDALDSTGMLTDFRHLEWLKRWINSFVDHQFILSLRDPLYKQMIGDVQLIEVLVPGTAFVAGYNVHPDALGEPNTPQYEYLEGFLFVDFVPTSENLSKWMCDIVNSKMYKLGVICTQIDWWETPKSRSSYYTKG